MPIFELIEELRCRPDPPLSDVHESLADAFLRISLGGLCSVTALKNFFPSLNSNVTSNFRLPS